MILYCSLPKIKILCSIPSGHPPPVSHSMPLHELMFVIADQQPAERLRDIQMLRLQRRLLFQHDKRSQPVAVHRNREDRSLKGFRLSGE